MSPDLMRAKRRLREAENVALRAVVRYVRIVEFETGESPLSVGQVPYELALARGEARVISAGQRLRAARARVEKLRKGKR